MDQSWSRSRSGKRAFDSISDKDIPGKYPFSARYVGTLPQSGSEIETDVLSKKNTGRSSYTISEDHTNLDAVRRKRLCALGSGRLRNSDIPSSRPRRVLDKGSPQQSSLDAGDGASEGPSFPSSNIDITLPRGEQSAADFTCVLRAADVVLGSEAQLPSLMSLFGPPTPDGESLRDSSTRAARGHFHDPPRERSSLHNPSHTGTTSIPQTKRFAPSQNEHWYLQVSPGSIRPSASRSQTWTARPPKRPARFTLGGSESSDDETAQIQPPRVYRRQSYTVGGSPGYYSTDDDSEDLCPPTCDFCPESGKTCKPNNRVWPSKCDRCIDLNLECSPPKFEGVVSESRKKHQTGRLTTSPPIQALDRFTKLASSPTATVRMGDLRKGPTTWEPRVGVLNTSKDRLSALPSHGQAPGEQKGTFRHS